MRISRKHPITQQMNTLEIPVTEKQYADWMFGGKLIQEAMPFLSEDYREFILTGFLPGEYDELFQDSEN